VVYADNIPVLLFAEKMAKSISSPKIRCSILNYKGQIEEHYEQQNKDFAERIEWSEEHDG
jgi:hypothetical protein